MCRYLIQLSFRDQASDCYKRLHRSITTWEDLTTRFLAQFFPPGRTAKLRNDILMFQQHHGESLSNWTLQGLLQKSPSSLAKTFWPLRSKFFMTKDISLYDNESWNDPKDFAKPVKAIALPQDVPSTSDHRIIELENQVQCLMEAHLALTQPTQMKKSLPHVRSSKVPMTLSIAWKIPNKPLLNTHPRVPMKREVQQLCLLCECLQKSIPAIQDNCASLQSITALESSLSLKKLRIAKGKRVMYGEDELMEGNMVFGGWG
ncbi:MAK10-like protein [Tanacetum coccineum]